MIGTAVLARTISCTRTWLLQVIRIAPQTFVSCRSCGKAADPREGNNTIAAIYGVMHLEVEEADPG